MTNLKNELTTKLQDTLNLICNKFEIKQVDIQYKSMEDKSRYLESENLILISKDYLENFYSSLEIILQELIQMDIDENTRAKLDILANAFKSLGKKKFITRDIKESLISLGFKEIIIGCKENHKITAKELKLDFFDYDIAVGIFAITIAYGSGRLYRALVYNFN